MKPTAGIFNNRDDDEEYLQCQKVQGVFFVLGKGGGNKDYKIDLEEGDLKLSSSSFTEDKGRLDCANMFSQMNPNKFRSQTNS